jgi:hypothetical protein
MFAPGQTMTGIYTLNGGGAALYHNGATFGAAVLNGNTLTVAISAEPYAGTYYFTKSGGGANVKPAA